MFDIHFWYVNMYILYSNIYKNIHPDAEVCFFFFFCGHNMHLEYPMR